MIDRGTRSRSGEGHSHAKYLVAIVLLAVTGGLLGFAQFSGASLLGVSRVPDQQQSFTLVHGTATVGDLGSVLAIYFEPGPLTSAVEGPGHAYRLYLVSERSYVVSIYYDSLSGIRQCTPETAQFTPIGEDALQDFRC